MALTSINIELRGVELEIIGDYIKGEDSDRDYPGSPSEFHVREILAGDVDIISLTSSDVDEIVSEKCLEELEE